MRLVLATHNPGKIKEIKSLLADLDIEILSAEQVGIFEEPVEDGSTLEENAVKKARFVSELANEWVVADDSGIFINALGGAPGVLSSRWHVGDSVVAYTLEKMRGIEDRSAYFETVVALMSPQGDCQIFAGRVDGVVGLEPRGVVRPKLPYDVLFVPQGYERTFAQMPDEEKNSISHRGKAFLKLKEFLGENKKRRESNPNS